MSSKTQSSIRTQSSFSQVSGSAIGWTRLVGAGVAALLVSSCVARSQYDRVVTEYHSENQARLQLEGELSRRESESNALRAKLDASHGQLTDAEQARASSLGRIQELERLLEEARMAAENSMKEIDGAEIFRTKDGFAYRLKSELLFDSGSTKIKESGKGALQKIAQEILRQGYDDVRIDGHTDSDPVVVTRETFPLGNLQLAVERALSVYAFLVNDAGVSKDVFTLASFGPNRPAVTGNTPEAKAKNRRVEIHVRVGSAAGGE